ncbi:MAG: A/G-specific adenine glycosylase, partial [Enterobacterales bacterium]|nr:A/G-specific adenine glycosylase [Enterobacterales bacterium]
MKAFSLPLNKSQIAHFQTHLLTWFDVHGRHNLPWQIDKTPYRVWVSEIMLQQTQVTTVIPYFERFMTSFPTLTDLAIAEQDEVLSHWSGLGYYARARNMHKAAQIILKDYAGELPQSHDEMVSLPGIGRSTAGAILAISSNQNTPIQDGNVRRVLSRLFAIEGDLTKADKQKQLWQIATELTPAERVADYTQAIM